MNTPSKDFEDFSWRKIGKLHLFCIAVAPYLFGLPVIFREGYSKKAKLITAVYAVLFVLVMVGGRKSGDGTESPVAAKVTAEQAVASQPNQPAAKE